MPRRVTLRSYNGEFTMDRTDFRKVCEELSFDPYLFFSEYTYDDAELIEQNYPELIRPA